MISKVSRPPTAATPKASQRARFSPSITPPSSSSTLPVRSDQPVGIGNAGDPDLVLAGAQRVAGRLDRAAARAPVLQRGGDARLGGAVAQQPLAARMGDDPPLGVEDDGRVRRSIVRSRAEVVDQRAARQPQRSRRAPPTTLPLPANTGIVSTTIGSPETRDSGDAADHRPALAHRVLEVVAVGDVGVRVAQRRARRVTRTIVPSVEATKTLEKSVARTPWPATKSASLALIAERRPPPTAARRCARRAAGRRAAATSSPRSGAHRPPASRGRSARCFARLRAARRSRSSPRWRGSASRRPARCAPSTSEGRRFPGPCAFMLFGTAASLPHLRDAKCVKLLPPARKA